MRRCTIASGQVKDAPVAMRRFRGRECVCVFALALGLAFGLGLGLGFKLGFGLGLGLGAKLGFGLGPGAGGIDMVCAGEVGVDGSDSAAASERCGPWGLWERARARAVAPGE